MTRRTLILAICAATVATAVVRLLVLSMIEPRYDQAFFAWWVRLLVESEHFWPRSLPGEGLLLALKTDTGSFLHQLFRNLYNKPTSVLTLVPLSVMSGAVTAVENSYATQTVVSILWSTLLLPLLGSFGAWGRGTGPTRYGTGLLALALAALNPSLFWFAPLGIHNFGIVGLAAAVAATEARLGGLARGDRSRQTVAIEAGFHLLAYFSHWTNAFLLPPAALTARLLTGRNLRRGVEAALGYLPILAVVGLALAPLIAVEFFRPVEDQTHSLATVTKLTTAADTSQLLHSLLGGSQKWVEMAGQTFTWPGTAGALAGLVLMWRRGIRSPALVVLVHFAFYVVMPGFSGAGLRVFPYVIPLLCLGLAELVLALAIRWKAAALALVALNLAQQMPPLAIPSRAEAALPHLWDFYYRGQGELRPMIREMDQLVPKDGVLLSWSYGLYCVHEALRGGPPIASVLDGLWLRHTQGTLAAYLAGRPRITARRVFLITEDNEQAELSPVLAETLPILLGTQGLDLIRRPRLVPLGHWRLTTSSPGDTTLWEVIEGDGG